MLTREEKRNWQKKRIRNPISPDTYDYRPATVQNERVSPDVETKVAIYCRVSTDDPSQTTSFELQQVFYSDMVAGNPNWTLVKIYADEGRSGVTSEHRPGFQQMLEDAKAGKFDLIITKSISRLARNTELFLNTLRKLTGYHVGVFFESEHIYSLNQDARTAIELQASMAAMESRNRSRSMEASLRMRLDHGLPLTPELLGLMKDVDGKLIINPETADTVRLMFNMCLLGYSTQQIADAMTKLMKKTYLGNVIWSAGGVVRTLRNEKYCGDIETRKRFNIFAADVGEDGQKSFKNNGERPQTYYHGEHERIVSVEDFLAVQRILDNSKYGGSSILPELCVIPDGLLRGFVIVHPHWGGFTEEDYIRACESVEPDEIKKETGPLNNYKVVDSSLFSDRGIPNISIQNGMMSFGTAGIRAMKGGNYVELLVHPLRKEIAVRPTTSVSMYAIKWANGKFGRTVGGKAFIPVLCRIFGWEESYSYKMYGCIYREGKDAAGIFSAKIPSVYIDKNEVEATVGVLGQLLGQKGKMVRAFTNSLGVNYYEEKSMCEHRTENKKQWQTQIEGQKCEMENELKITPYETLQRFVKEQLGDLYEEEQLQPRERNLRVIA